MGKISQNKNALKTTLIYFLISALWILISDNVVLYRRQRATGAVAALALVAADASWYVLDPELNSGARCGGAGQIVRPLIIEWPATDRASLESRLRRGPVVVRYEGCLVEVLRDCAAPEAPEGGYEYLGITRKNDRLTIRTADELRLANERLRRLDRWRYRWLAD